MKWRLNFHVQNFNFNQLHYNPFAIFSFLPEKEGKKILSEMIIEFRDGECLAYFPLAFMDKMVSVILEQIITDETWADQVNTQCEAINWEYFRFAQTLLEENVSQMSGEKLLDNLTKLRELQQAAHFFAITTTWFVDSNKEEFSQYLRNALKEHFETQGISDPIFFMDTFVLLTTPTKENFAFREQIDFLKLCKAIRDDQIVLKIFREKKNLEEIWKDIGDKARECIRTHWKKWQWIPYGYIGPAFTLEHYIFEIQKTLLHVENIDALLFEENSRFQKVLVSQNALREKIHLSKNLDHIFAIARDIIWLKEFRKSTYFHGHFVLDFFTAEIARRIHVSHKQANHMLPDEHKAAFLSGNVDEHFINERMNYHILYVMDETKKVEWFIGEKARVYRESLDIEEEKISGELGWHGSCACPGEVEGEVKIINTPEEMEKMNKGDIMLALTTYPSLLPAMKKAAAIVTEDGGITCHAAIVAREFRIPCVVGVKKISAFLKDGDWINVNATEGKIQKIEK